ncbi:hypothetical protein THARTR1_10564 [Trichoderma harzianum]|uniref:Uncharacterized protein n=1 Tax=Trichoderma harzianum TaxID=5544 RepID=A0A2K0TNG1_TRIHA|nr:hypothetical protein THARTR1_10564 [Trichoderma harzianum]
MLSSKRAPPASLSDVLVVGTSKSGMKSARFLGGGPSKYSKSSSFLMSVYRLLNLELDTFEGLGAHAVPFDGSDDPSSSLCTLPIWPLRNLTLMPRGWSPDVRTSWTTPCVSRPVGWSSFRMIKTAAPGTTCLEVGTVPAACCGVPGAPRPEFEDLPPRPLPRGWFCRG